jgi:undecaprenyl-diphosphatase
MRARVGSTSQRRSETRRAITRARQWAAGLAAAFAVVAVLVGTGATDGIDRWASRLSDRIASYPLDVAASAFNVLGQIETTGLVALVLAFVWWRRDGVRGLVPLLLFAGIAAEVVLKHVVPHAGPPPGLCRTITWLPGLHGSSPYSFPSGHMLRVTFLAALVADRWIFWVVAAVMAVTRIYLNEHWLSDVLGGFLLGASLAGLAASLFADPAA